jgi:hypothetical protein
LQVTTEEGAAVIVKRLPEWSQFKWSVEKDNTGKLAPLLERRTHWTKTDLKALVPWHQMEGPDGDDDDERKTLCLRKWLGDALPVTPLGKCVRRGVGGRAWGGLWRSQCTSQAWPRRKAGSGSEDSDLATARGVRCQRGERRHAHADAAVPRGHSQVLPLGESRLCGWMKLDTQGPYPYVR